MANSAAQYPTSYFSAPATALDPTLFDGRTIKPWVRQGITSLLNDFLGKTYRNAETWAHPWLAGSGVSYQWTAARQPGDLDCLVGVDYINFRKDNPEYVGLSDSEISNQINEEFRKGLQPGTENWNGYELTFYVNSGATDIRSIKPYAAYDLKYDNWTVTPDPNAAAPQNPDWERAVSVDRAQATQALTRFTQALQDVQQSQGEAVRRNAEARLNASLQSGTALFDEIHGNRGQAFSSTGEGYLDFSNYRWQAGKREGTIQDLRKIAEYAKGLQQSQAASYGVELPSADVLIRRAALARVTY